MKKILGIFLAVVLILSISACRRRITADGENVVYETVYQPQPVPMEGEGQQIPDAATDPDNTDTKTERDPDGDRVDETVGAEGGETTPDAPETPHAGEKITVTLDAAGGECAKDTVTVHAGGVYGVLPTPQKSGMTFQGWFLQAEGGEKVNPVSVVLEKTDHTLYAHWTTKTEFVLTFDPNGGRVSPYYAEKKIYAGDVYGQLPKPIWSGYAFLGWFTQPDGGVQIHPADMVTVIDDQTVYAHWEYDPYAYWAFVLENTTQKVFTCQQVSVYVELEANGTTMVYCPLITDTGSRNIAQYEQDGFVTDDWVREKKPNIIIKITDRIGAAQAIQTAVERRFPDARVYVFPAEAVSGTEGEQLYYKLCLASLAYPQYYSKINLEDAAKELGIAG